MENKIFKNLRPETLAVRAGTLRSQYKEHSDAIFVTSSFVQDSAEQAARMFALEEDGYTYSRTGNPSVSMFESRIAALEECECAVATNSCMSAILLLGLATLKAGDSVICSRSVFGSTMATFTNIFSKFGVETIFVSQTNVDEWKRAIRPSTKLFFAETPSNPLMEICDMAALAKLAHEHGAYLAVDNTFCTGMIQKPAKFGADFVVLSGTKFLDGQGRTLSGAICTSKQLYDEKLFPVSRMVGTTLSPFNAWVVQKGLETLPIRIKSECASAENLANWLNVHPSISKVYYPKLAVGDQYLLAKMQQSESGEFLGGAVLSFEAKSEKCDAESLRARAFSVINKVELLSRTTNLGDVRTTISHPASTSHGRLTEEQRQAAGISQGLIRISCGLEHIEDLKADLAQALDSE